MRSIPSDRQDYGYKTEMRIEPHAPQAGPGQPVEDRLLLLMMCLLQDLHGLSDEETEFQVDDCTSFRWFLGLSKLEEWASQCRRQESDL